MLLIAVLVNPTCLGAQGDQRRKYHPIKLTVIVCNLPDTSDSI